MKYLRQLAYILTVSFLGELLHALLPFPIPASIYGMLLLFLALCTGLLKPEQIRETGNYLVSIMGVLFICPAVGLLSCVELLRKHWIPILVIVVVSTALTFAVSGLVTQKLLEREAKDE